MLTPAALAVGACAIGVAWAYFTAPRDPDDASVPPHYDCDCGCDCPSRYHPVTPRPARAS